MFLVAMTINFIFLFFVSLCKPFSSGNTFTNENRIHEVAGPQSVLLVGVLLYVAEGFL